MVKYGNCAGLTLLGVPVLVLSSALAQTPVLTEQFKLLGLGVTQGDAFGRSVALAGTTGLIGAPISNGAEGSSGSVFVFDLSTGQQLTQLIADPLPGDDRPFEDGFGEDVVVAGDLTLFGAPNNETAGRFSGSAYLFRLSDGAQVERLLPFSPEPFSPVGSAFGEHVAISPAGNRLLIGARGDTGEDDQGANGGGGAVYLYDTDLGAVRKIFASDAAFADNFGTDVAISDEFAIASSPFDDDLGSSSGSVYVLDVATGEELAKLQASDGGPEDFFGLEVAISGGLAAIAAPFANSEAGPDTGAVYLFDLVSGEELTKITRQDSPVGERFGSAVAIDGSLLAIGAGQRAFVYDLTLGQFIAELRPSDSGPEQRFGEAIAIAGAVVVVGAEGDSTQGANAGAAYVFTLEDVEPEAVARVVAIAPDLFPRGGRFGAEVAVTVEDTLGRPVANAQVIARVSGDIAQNVAGMTDANGLAVLRTRRAAQPPVTYLVCVSNVIADLPYERLENVETCDSL